MPIKIFILLPFSAFFIHVCLSLSENPSVRVDQNPSDVVFPVLGHVYPDGFLYVKIQIGTPPKSVLVDFDTGAELSWLQCGKDCDGCTKLIKDRYMPHDNYISCSDRICIDFHFPKKPMCLNKQCIFEVKYGDKRSISGALVYEKFPTTAGDRNNKFVFGCVNKMRGFKDVVGGEELEGSIGLGRGKLSYNSQISKAMSKKNVFAHCISREGKSYLSLGLDPVQQPSTVTWTKLLKIPESEIHYISAVPQIFYGRSKLIERADRNVIFDSGATYSYFNKDIVKILFDEIRKGLRWKPMVEVPEKERENDLKKLVCWRASRGSFRSIDEAKSYFQELKIEFSGPPKVEMLVPTEAYVIFTEKKHFCVGIIEDDQHNIIGANFMQDKLVIYDNEREQIGWTSKDCSTPHTT